MRVKIKWFKKYEISPYWKVRSLSYNKTNEVRLLKPNNWYYSLHWVDWVKNIKISRLVAQAYLRLDITNKDICVLHKDCDRTNNKANNLLLWTHWDGQKHYLSQNKMITHKKRRSNPDYINQTKEIMKLKWRGLTLTAISEIVWLSTSYISLISNWKRRVYEVEY